MTFAPSELLQLIHRPHSFVSQFLTPSPISDEHKHASICYRNTRFQSNFLHAILSWQYDSEHLFFSPLSLYLYYPCIPSPGCFLLPAGLLSSKHTSKWASQSSHFTDRHAYTPISPSLPDPEQQPLQGIVYTRSTDKQRVSLRTCTRAAYISLTHIWYGEYTAKGWRGGIHGTCSRTFKQIEEWWLQTLPISQAETQTKCSGTWASCH